VVSTNIGVELTTDTTPTADRDRVTNSLRTALRDAWIGNGNPDIAEIAVGTDPSNLSRTNTSLENETDRVDAFAFLQTPSGVDYNSSFSEQDIQEIGLFDSDGTLYYRAVFDSPTTVTDVTVSLSVTNDESYTKGVVTNDGQVAVRDIITDNSTAIPDTYAFGSDGTEPTEADTTLGNELTTVALDDQLLGSADTTTEWESLVPSIPATTPAFIENGFLKAAQIGFVNDLTGSADRTDFSGGSGEILTSNTQTGYFIDIDLEYEADSLQFYVRGQDTDTSDDTVLEVFVDGSFEGNVSLPDADVGIGSTGLPTLGPGTYTISLEPNRTLAYGQSEIDLIAVADTDYGITIDNTVDEADGYLDGPELFPDLAEISLATQTTELLVSTARVESTWNDVSNNQYIELSNDGTNYIRTNNSQTATADFANDNEDVDVNLGLSRYSSGTRQTPLFGDLGQEVDLFELFADVVATRPDTGSATETRAIVEAGTITGSTIQEAGIKSGSTLLTRSIVPEFTVESNMTVLSSEIQRFDQQ